MFWIAVASAQEPTSTLEQAYQKEFAYLHAEKAELDARLREIDGDAAARVGKADRELEALQARLVATTRRADRAEDEFDALERETAAMDDAAVLLATTVGQAADELGLGPQADPAAALPAVFSAAVARLAADNAIGVRDEAFFLPNGEQVQGRVYRWGRIAAWGLHDSGSGALAPAGEGRLQLRRELGRATAEALAVGRSSPVMEVQLFEPERTAEETEKAGGLAQTLKEAGTMGQVLFGLGCVSGFLVLVRGVTLLFARRGGMPLVEAITRLVAAGDFDRARTTLGKRRGPVARVLGAILDGASRGREERERIVDEAILRETPGIDRFASALVVITAGAPLMGLLGTVTGMIATFDVITEHGTGNPKLMSAGIAEALICTALGLAVAIPTLLAGNVLASVADTVKTTLERGALSLLNALELARPDEQEAAK
jgi:biopolymer transport protein ExbB